MGLLILSGAEGVQNLLYQHVRGKSKKDPTAICKNVLNEMI